MRTTAGDLMGRVERAVMDDTGPNVVVAANWYRLHDAQGIYAVSAPDDATHIGVFIGVPPATPLRRVEDVALSLEGCQRVRPLRPDEISPCPVPIHGCLAVFGL